ncbi:MAG: hypothetical protein KF730_17230 [Sphingomonas sp.]|uniref:hypothetical protein n=1 Tax=Sphingomonas sp. TaxID=28214 RepID=UPI0025FA8FDB|nr:hypothetical protein [Sphingomonas sp.]MBX3566305.1 hypothetical protein [Sphingomonas sp.]
MRRHRTPLDGTPWATALLLPGIIADVLTGHFELQKQETDMLWIESLLSIVLAILSILRALGLV